MGLAPAVTTGKLAKKSVLFECSIRELSHDWRCPVGNVCQKFAARGTMMVKKFAPLLSSSFKFFAILLKPNRS